MKKTILALVTTLGALGAVSAHAADLKPYVGVGVVTSEHKYNLSNDSSTGDRKSYEWGGKIYGGVQLDKTFAVEGGYTDFGKSSYGYSVGALNGRVESDAKSFYLAGKGSLPINEQFSVFGKLGVAHNKNDVTASGLGAAVRGEGSNNRLYASVGGEYAINQKVSLALEYEHYGKNEIDLGRSKGAVSMGAKFAF